MLCVAALRLEVVNVAWPLFKVLVPSVLAKLPGARRLAAPAHSHDHYEETIYGIDCVLTWTVNGKQIDVGPGQALCIPRGAIHRFDNNGTGREGALRDHASRDRSAVFPRVCRGGQCGGRWSAGPSKGDGDHASPRPYAGSAPASGVAPSSVPPNIKAIPRHRSRDGSTRSTSKRSVARGQR